MNRDEYQSHSSDEKRKRSEESSEETEVEGIIESDNNRAIASLWKTVERLQKIVIDMCSN